MDPVLAYLDPGSGSVILQALLGGIAGVALTLKLFGRRVVDFFRRRPKSDSQPPAAPESDAL